MRTLWHIYPKQTKLTLNGAGALVLNQMANIAALNLSLTVYKIDYVLLAGRQTNNTPILKINTNILSGIEIITQKTAWCANYIIMEHKHEGIPIPVAQTCYGCGEVIWPGQGLTIAGKEYCGQCDPDKVVKKNKEKNK